MDNGHGQRREKAKFQALNYSKTQYYHFREIYAEQLRANGGDKEEAILSTTIIILRIVMQQNPDAPGPLVANLIGPMVYAISEG